MNDHVLMFGFLYPFFSDKNNGLLLYLYTAYFSCESEFASVMSFLYDFFFL